MMDEEISLYVPIWREITAREVVFKNSSYGYYVVATYWEDENLTQEQTATINLVDMWQRNYQITWDIMDMAGINRDIYEAQNGYKFGQHIHHHHEFYNTMESSVMAMFGMGKDIDEERIINDAAHVEGKLES